MKIFLFALLAFTFLADTALAQGQLPSFSQKKAETESAARSPEVLAAEAELEFARREYADALRRAKRKEGQISESKTARYEVEVAELQLRKAMLLDADLPEKRKVVLRRDLDTALARTKVKFVTSEYETIKRLYSRGHRTQQELKRASYAVKISQLELRRAMVNASDVEDREKLQRLQELEIEAKQMAYDLTLSDYELMKKLYRKSGVSKRKVLYQQFLVKAARIDVVHAKLEASSLSDVEKRFKRSDLVLAKVKAKHKFLKGIHDSNAGLYKRGSITKQQYLKSLEELQKVEIELEAAKDAAISEVET